MGKEMFTRKRPMYYRVAVQGARPPTWRWKSTVLSSLNTLLQWFQFYRALPQDRVRVFASSSREDLDEQLERENTNPRASSLTARQFLQKMGFALPEGERGESAGGNAENQGTMVSALTVPRERAEYGGEAQEEEEEPMAQAYAPLREPPALSGSLHVVVDLNRCQAYAQCCFFAPGVFQLHGEEALWYDPEPPAAQREQVLRAAAACPVQAIFVEWSRATSRRSAEEPHEEP